MCPVSKWTRLLWRSILPWGLRCMALPLPVILNRLAEPLWVFILGMIVCILMFPYRGTSERAQRITAVRDNGTSATLRERRAHAHSPGGAPLLPQGRSVAFLPLCI